MVSAGKDSGTQCRGDPGVCVAPGNVDPGVAAPLVVPFDGKPVGHILGGQPGRSREMRRAYGAHPDEAHASDGMAVDQLRPEWAGQQCSDSFWVDAVADEQPPLDDAVNVSGDHRADSFGSRVEARRWRSATCSGQTADRKLPTQAAS